jgi:hypothetical protein
MDERSENFTFQAFHSKMQVIFTCRKILWHGVSGFTSHPKEGLLVQEAARCKAQLLATWLSGSRVRITLEAWMFVCLFICCIALFDRDLCDDLITLPKDSCHASNKIRGTSKEEAMNGPVRLERHRKKKEVCYGFSSPLKIHHLGWV